MQTDKNDATATHYVPRADGSSGRLEVRCPSCHAPLQVAVDTLLTDLTCSSCGSHFSLVDQSKPTRMAPALTTMGRFDLIERLGVGGFGAVWKARDKELDRTVAVKIPRHGAMTAEEQERFFREARAAAQLHHPGIVSVHEVGRDGDSVYIVSDFIRGVTLGDWLTGQKLTSREAAELCAKIAGALHHAHEHGVVHRDLKPANVMIDGEGEPHLMDFGLARRDVDEVTVTVDGHILGTPAYMSPEQAQGEAHTADRRSDVYSLGVILFQLVTGELPFRGNARMLVHQVINEDATSPRKFNSNVSKDMETITLKCLEKHPVRRYQTAELLAEDLQRLLKGETILARPSSRLERAAKWVRRHKAVSVLSSAIVVTLLVGLTLSSIGFLQARRQAVRADRAAAQATAVSDFLQEMIQSANPDELKGQEYTVRQMLNDFSAGLNNQLASQPAVEAELQKTIGLAYRRLDADKSAQHLRRAMELRSRLVGNQHQEFADSLVDYAAALTEQRRTDDAERLLRRALAIYKKHGTRGTPPIRALQVLQIVLQIQNRLDEIQAVVDQALMTAKQTPDVDFPEIANIYHGLIHAKIEQSKFVEAEALGRKCVELHLNLHGPNHPETAWGYLNLGRALTARDKTAEAVDAFQQAAEIFRRTLPIGRGHSGAQALAGLTGALQRTLQSDRLLELFHSPRKLMQLQTVYRESLPINLDLTDCNPDTAAAVREGLATLADIHLKLSAEFAAAGEADQAKVSAAKVKALREELTLLDPKLLEIKTKLVADSPNEREFRRDLAWSYIVFGNLLVELGQFDRAREQYEQVLAIRTKLVADFPNEWKYRVDLAWSYYDLAKLFAGLGDSAGTHEQNEQASAIKKKLITEFPEVIEYRGDLTRNYIDFGHLLAGLRDFAGARKNYEQALAVQANHVETLNELSWLFATSSHDAQRDGKRAIELATKACELTNYKNANIVDTLAAAYAEAGDFEAAVRWSETSLDLLDGSIGHNSPSESRVQFCSGSKTTRRINPCGKNESCKWYIDWGRPTTVTCPRELGTTADRPDHETTKAPATSKSTDARFNGDAFRKHASRRAPTGRRLE